MPDVLRLTRPQLNAIIAHARGCRPEEACGILAGANDGGVSTVTRLFLVENAEHSSASYMMDSREQFRVFDEMRGLGIKPVSIFHSHPHSPAYPSGVDLQLAFYPESLYLIVSLMSDEPEARVFRIAEGRIEEAGLEVTESPHDGVREGH